MYYFDYAYTGKGTTKIKTKTGTKIKKAASCKNRFHYITRTAHYKNHKDNLHEKVEFVKSGNMPSFAENRPDQFWEAAHNYERKNARTAASHSGCVAAAQAQEAARQSGCPPPQSRMNFLADSY